MGNPTPETARLPQGECEFQVDTVMKAHLYMKYAIPL